MKLETRELSQNSPAVNNVADGKNSEYGGRKSYLEGVTYALRRAAQICSSFCTRSLGFTDSPRTSNQSQTPLYQKVGMCRYTLAGEAPRVRLFVCVCGFALTLLSPRSTSTATHRVLSVFVGAGVGTQSRCFLASSNKRGRSREWLVACR